MLIQKFNELADSIELICKMCYDEQTTFHKRGPRDSYSKRTKTKINTYEFVVEFMFTPDFEFKNGSRDRFSLNNGHCAFKVTYDINSNILYIYSKYKAIIKTHYVTSHNTSSKALHNSHTLRKKVLEPEGLRKMYKKLSLSPKRINKIERYSVLDNARFHYDHFFVSNEKNLKRISQLFSVFLDYHTERLVD